MPSVTLTISLDPRNAENAFKEMFLVISVTIKLIPGEFNENVYHHRFFNILIHSLLWAQTDY
jgi:hypothetical protein